MAYNSDNFDLHDWNISIPVDSSGGTTGVSVIISPLKNYESAEYFYDNPDGSMTFYAPVDGATTKSSYGARSELRELNDDGTLAHWNLAQGGTMTATLAVNALPSYNNGTPGKEMIGQIHGSSNELCRLYYDNGQIYFKNDRPGTGVGSKFMLTDAAGHHPTVAFGEKFSYEIDAHGSTLTVKVFVGGDTYSSVTQIDPYWQTDSLYFKAGVYLGVTKTPDVDVAQGYGAGQDTFYGLDMSHTLGQGLGGLQAPVAQPDNFIAQESAVITGNVLADNGHGMDAGPSGLTLSLAAAAQTTAHGGAVMVNADGSFTYTPAAGFFGADSFTYTLKDGAGLTSTGNVSINVNAPPVAQADSFTGQAGHAVTGNVLANDSDPDAGSLLVQAQTLASAHGAVVLNADGSFVYTPVSGYTGADSFSYTATDGNGGTATATVSLTLIPAQTTDIIPAAVTAALHGNVPVPTLTGTDGNDSLDGTHGHVNNVILALGGNNTAMGHDGNDVLIGGSGNDKLYGYYGDDIIYGGAGTNIMDGGAGNDTLISGAGQNTMTGGAGDDVFVFQEPKINTHDIITDFNDGDKLDISALLGTTGTAQLQTVSGVTGLYVDPDGAGQAHAALVVTFEGTSVVNGTDIFVNSSPVTQTPPPTDIPAAVTAALHGNVPTPTMTGTDGNDNLDGTHGHVNNVILALGGNNTAMGHDGNDVLIGGSGNDKLYGYYGDDVIYGGAGTNIMDGGAGNDTLISGAGQNTMTGGDGNDVFVLGESKALNIHDIITDFGGGDKLDISALLGQTGTAQLQTVSGVTGLYVDPDGAGQAHAALVVSFEGHSTINALTLLPDILI